VNPALSHLGYNKRMPIAVVFSSKVKGGIGVLVLATEQGVSQVNLLISHLRSKSPIHNTAMIMLESYQLHAGTYHAAPMHTHPYKYVQSPWMTLVREFLDSVKGQIHIPDLTTIKLLQEHNSSIMDILVPLFTKSELQSINACQLFLQVTLVLEITDDSGSFILPDALYGRCDEKCFPVIWKYSTSKFTWPAQIRPPQSS
jgi:hypothetical protein